MSATGGLRVGVLASGEGTNLQALLDRVHGREGITLVAVASDRPQARALERARAAGIPAAVFQRGHSWPGGPGAADASEGADERTARDLAIAGWLQEHGVQLVVLAGYMQLLAPEFLERFPRAVINVHPALLPAFPGLGAVQQALDYGVKVFGVTVHFVDAGIDTGPVILQRAIELPDAREAGEVLDALRPLEHELLPKAVALIARGAVRPDPSHPRRVLLQRPPGG